MSESYKVLGQDLAVAIEPNSGLNEANIVYTVPENTSATVSAIRILNSSNSNVDYKLGVVKAADVNGSTESVPGQLFPFVVIGGLPRDPFAAAAYSTDAITWTQTTMSSSTSWASVAYGDQKFVAVAYSTSTAAYSTDGITWTTSTMPSSAQWHSVSYANDKFFAIASYGTSAYSTDGVAWSSFGGISRQLGFFRGQKSKVVYGDNIFVGVADWIYYSTDGVSWSGVSSDNWGDEFSSISQPSSMPFSASVAYGNGVFFAIHDHIANISTDGINWDGSNLSFYSNRPGGSISDVIFADGKFVIIYGGESNSSLAAYSTDAITWTTTSLPTSTTWHTLAYGDGKFVASEGSYGSGITAYSTDAITWTQGSTSLPVGTISLTYGEQLPDNTIKSILTTQTLIPTKTISAGEINEISGGINLGAGDQIRIYSDSEDLIIHVYGAELS